MIDFMSEVLCNSKASFLCLLDYFLKTKYGNIFINEADNVYLKGFNIAEK